MKTILGISIVLAVSSGHVMAEQHISQVLGQLVTAAQGSSVEPTAPKVVKGPIVYLSATPPVDGQSSETELNAAELYPAQTFLPAILTTTTTTTTTLTTTITK